MPGPAVHGRILGTVAEPLSPMPRNAFWIALACVALLRAALAALLPLSIDEPYYWLWAQHPAAGYYDHPPLMAWIGAPFTAFGWAPLVVRIGPILASTACAALVYVHARLLSRDETAALLAGLLVLLSPYYWVMAILLSPESALLVTWAAVGATWQAAVFPPGQKAALPAWIAAGATLGLALLAKFTALALPCGLVLFFIVSPRSRRLLARPGPWVAAATSLLVVAPFLAWNARHAWQTFVFQMVARQQGAERHLDLAHFARFLGEMALGLSPFTALAAACAATWGLRLAWRAAPSPDAPASTEVEVESEPVRLALCLSLPTLLAALAGALFSHEVQVYWTLCAFLPIFPLAGCWLAERLRGPRSVLWRRLGLAGAGFALIPLITAMVLATQPAWLFRVLARGEGNGLTELYCMGELAQRIESERTGMPRPRTTFVAAEDHRLASHLTGLLDKPAVMFSTDRRGLEYRRWQDFGPLRGWDAVVVLRAPFDTDRRLLRERLAIAFDRLEEGRRVEVRRDGRVGRVFYVARCYGFHPERAGPLATLP